MKRNFDIPELNIEMLSTENIITTSGNVANVDIVKANLTESGVDETATQTFSFDELITAE